MWRGALLLLSLAAGSRQLSIKEFSVPAAIEAGEDVSLNCKYDLLKNESESGLFVKWWWTPLNGTSDQRYQLYQRIYGHTPEAIQHHHNIEIGENDEILLVNVTTEHSGTYECEVSNIDEVRQHKKLIVFTFGSGPLLNVTVTEDEAAEEQRAALVTCEAYGVAPYPDVSITLNGEVLKSSGYVTQEEDAYDIYENATVPLDEANDGEFRCEILFQDSEVPHAPYVASLIFAAPTATAAEPAAPAPEPPAAPEPNDNGSNVVVGRSWMLLLSILLYCIIFNCEFIN